LYLPLFAAAAVVVVGGFKVIFEGIFDFSLFHLLSFSYRNIYKMQDMM
jgi:hypothetical protein